MIGKRHHNCIIYLDEGEEFNNKQIYSHKNMKCFRSSLLRSLASHMHSNFLIYVFRIHPKLIIVRSLLDLPSIIKFVLILKDPFICNRTLFWFSYELFLSSGIKYNIFIPILKIETKSFLCFIIILFIQKCQRQILGNKLSKDM